MAETLIAWFTRFTDDPKKLASRLAGRPVLVYEPPVRDEPGDDSEDDFQFRTSAGDGAINSKTGEAVVALVEKTKDNAFQRRVTLGRTTNNDIVLEDASVSRFHAWLQLNEKAVWEIVDAGSRNGTFVNGRRLAQKVGQSLDNDQRVRIGSVELRFFTAKGFQDYLARRATER